jgi:hypothetical protein
MPAGTYTIDVRPTCAWGDWVVESLMATWPWAAQMLVWFIVVLGPPLALGMWLNERENH